MRKYVIIWRDYADFGSCEIFQSVVSTDRDPVNMTVDDWVRLAASSEGWRAKDINELIEDGYGLYLVCDYPDKFYV